MDRIQWWRPAHHVLNQISSEWYKPSSPISRQAPTGGLRKGVSEWIPQHTFFSTIQTWGWNITLYWERSCVTSDARPFVLAVPRWVNPSPEGTWGDAPTPAMQDNRSGSSSFGWKRVERHDGGRIPWEQGMCAMLIAARDGLPASIMEAARKNLGIIAAGHGHFGVSQFNSFLVVHYMGNSSHTARRMMRQCWSLLWPEMQARETAARN